MEADSAQAGEAQLYSAPTVTSDATYRYAALKTRQRTSEGPVSAAADAAGPVGGRSLSVSPVSALAPEAGGVMSFNGLAEEFTRLLDAEREERIKFEQRLDETLEENRFLSDQMELVEVRESALDAFQKFLLQQQRKVDEGTATLLQIRMRAERERESGAAQGQGQAAESTGGNAKRREAGESLKLQNGLVQRLPQKLKMPICKELAARLRNLEASYLTPLPELPPFDETALNPRSRSQSPTHPAVSPVVDKNGRWWRKSAVVQTDAALEPSEKKARKSAVIQTDNAIDVTGQLMEVGAALRGRDSLHSSKAQPGRGPGYSEILANRQKQGRKHKSLLPMHLKGGVAAAKKSLSLSPPKRAQRSLSPIPPRPVRPSSSYMELHMAGRRPEREHEEEEEDDSEDPTDDFEEYGPAYGKRATMAASWRPRPLHGKKKKSAPRHPTGPSTHLYAQPGLGDKRRSKASRGVAFRGPGRGGGVEYADDEDNEDDGEGESDVRGGSGYLHPVERERQRDAARRRRTTQGAWGPSRREGLGPDEREWTSSSRVPHPSFAHFEQSEQSPPWTSNAFVPVPLPPSTQVLYPHYYPFSPFLPPVRHTHCTPMPAGTGDTPFPVNYQSAPPPFRHTEGPSQASSHFVEGYSHPVAPMDVAHSHQLQPQDASSQSEQQSYLPQHQTQQAQNPAQGLLWQQQQQTDHSHAQEETSTAIGQTDQVSLAQGQQLHWQQDKRKAKSLAVTPSHQQMRTSNPQASHASKKAPVSQQTVKTQSFKARASSPSNFSHQPQGTHLPQSQSISQAPQLQHQSELQDYQHTESTNAHGLHQAQLQQRHTYMGMMTGVQEQQGHQQPPRTYSEMMTGTGAQPQQQAFHPEQNTYSQIMAGSGQQQGQQELRCYSQMMTSRGPLTRVATAQTSANGSSDSSELHSSYLFKHRQRQGFVPLPPSTHRTAPDTEASSERDRGSLCAFYLQRALEIAGVADAQTYLSAFSAATGTTVPSIPHSSAPSAPNRHTLLWGLPHEGTGAPPQMPMLQARQTTTAAASVRLSPVKEESPPKSPAVVSPSQSQSQQMSIILQQPPPPPAPP
uniref:Uncharacterized protein n=1 Tax=Chromera velia CCMP2878 TaxID=1169474 RepID=A0A0G4GRR1_9ALVE|eukprot:Cvel_23097.t1-p1 / transcript=Cvel_23097.t1 / gene=Cvel_23097 / organism=Chromera_velia_CCMP2878 / gene_product=Adenylate cyclase, terminal-differentiation, putative / transcript_product=Adenylate cyclase, terminal-differentiation, putative / location=Cvel_scaffold2343:7516-13900(+) / protein_length=1077 / sequence_SO=supercontig / SO=protein_coding / is_pseudo=false